MTIDLSTLDTTNIPERPADQDERITALVLRKAAGSPDTTEGQRLAALAALTEIVTATGYDLALSYIATSGIDVDPGGSASLASLAAPADPPSEG